ncbi:KH domain-containing protein [Bdellovibrio bacteriovorus]|uniref:KH domain-containing protein n=1 Tax=Bdellovibrio bacteriovorus TaxID=959 RepID=UPI0035A58C9E
MSAALSTNQADVRESLRSVLESVVKKIVTTPENIKVTYSVGERTTIYQIETVQTEYGRLVGSQGRMINALRTVIAGMAGTHGFRAILNFKNDEKFHQF